MRCSVSVLLGAAVLLVMVAQAATQEGRILGDSATRQAYQHRSGQRPSPPRVSSVVDARMPDMPAFAKAVARTRERVKCRDSDIILVSFPKASHIQRCFAHLRSAAVSSQCTLLLRLLPWCALLSAVAECSY